MEVSPVGYSPKAIDFTRKQPASQTLNQFGDMLSNSLQDVSRLQSRADDLATKVATGGDVDIHDAVLANEEASLAFQYTLQIRNKLIEAYQEVMRMQV
jgi:flagellar hook-basal body complex protein FliE